MEANELRIGNWVDTGKFHLPRYRGNYQMREGWFGYANKFSPIPLTEEWLLKFGLKKSESDYFELRQNMYTFGIKEAVDISGNVYFHPEKYSWSMFGFACRVYYVHQLQNLYFSLTNTDL